METKSTLFQVRDISDIERAFPTSIKDFMPPYSEIPEEFKNQNRQTKWNEIVSHWFFKGLNPKTQFIPVEGIDPKKALKHISYILGSWEPKHEHKEAGVAFLLSQWFSDIKDWKK